MPDDQISTDLAFSDPRIPARTRTLAKERHYVLLGFDAQKRKLLVNEAEAAQFRMICERYLALRSVDHVMMQLQSQDNKSKYWQLPEESVRGRPVLCGTARYTILRNRVYLRDAAL